MRVAIFSDVHANLAGFRAVISAGLKEAEELWCLGDLVGYGPDPEACINLARKTCRVILAGNHDLAACGKLDVSDFSYHARKAMEWTWNQISVPNKAFLAKLPTSRNYQGILLSHGSPRNPVWEYIMSKEDALEVFRDVTFTHCFFGHSHLPSAFILQQFAGRYQLKVIYGEANTQIDTASARNRYLLNPGSVGFPRDAQDAHASDSLETAVARYALFDTDTKGWTFRRILYDLRETAERMFAQGLW